MYGVFHGCYMSVPLAQAQRVLGAAGAGNYANFMDAYRTIVAREGFKGLFRGYWASNFTWWPWNIIYFVAYEHGRNAVSSYASFSSSAEHGDGSGPRTGSELPPWVSSACATAAAAAATVATNPIDLAKTRLQTLRVESSVSASVSVGPGADSGVVGGAGTSKSFILDTHRRRSGAGASSGFILDTHRGAALPASVGVFSVMRDVAAKEGVGALMTGCVARVWAIAPGSAISFFVYESIKEWCAAQEE